MASIKPSKKKHLSGLDNLTASRIIGFEPFLKLASKYRIKKTTTKAIQNWKRIPQNKLPNGLQDYQLFAA